MWPNGVVLFQLSRGDGPGQAAEQIQVKHLLSTGLIESFDAGIPGRLSVVAIQPSLFPADRCCHLLVL